MSDERTLLAEAQAALVRALVAGAEAPAEFDAGRVEAQRGSLARKRAHEVRHGWPALARHLGEGFHSRFTAYAERTPLPGEGGPLADGYAFAREVAREGSLSDEARLEVLRVEVRWARIARGLVRRRGPCIRAVLLRQARCLIVAMQLPGLGERWLRLGLPALRARAAPRRPPDPPGSAPSTARGAARSG